MSALSTVYSGKSDVGYRREVNEDCIAAKELEGDMLFIAVADGMGSLPGTFQPAAIAVNEMVNMLVRMTGDEEGRALLAANPAIFLREAVHLANRVIGAFKLGNEELYAGYGACVTCCLFHDDKYSFAHAGNTRLWLIRQGVIRQLTLDHTKAYRLFMDGIIDEEQYHTHPDNVVLTSGVGVVADPEVQIYEDAKLKEGDIVLLTTDGIHYSVRPDAMTDIIIDAKNCESAAASLVQAAVATRGMADNMSALLVFAVQGRKRA